MKKIIIILLIFPFFSLANPTLKPASKDVDNYKELNVGICYLGFPYPGFSFLWGKSIYYSNNTVLDYQAGLAFPTFVTGKIGYGLGNINSKVLLSIRPYPGTIGFQYDRRKILFSIEKMVGGFAESLGDNIIGDGWIVTLGFRLR